MDTHWNKKKKRFLGLVDRALRTSAAAFLTLVLVIPMMPQASPVAEAGDLQWDAVVSTETAAGDFTLADGITAIDVDACKGGTVFFLADVGVGVWDLYRSRDKGGSWEKVQAAAGGGGATTEGLRVLCSPSFTTDGAVLVGDASGIVRLYESDGDALTATTPALPAALGAVATDFAVAGDFDSKDEGAIAVGTIADADAEDLIGLITWDDTSGFSVAWTTIGFATADQVDAGDAAVAVGLSPKYNDDQGLAAVITFADNAGEADRALFVSGTTPECDTFGVSSQSTDFPDSVISASNLLGADLAVDCLADLADGTTASLAVNKAAIGIPSNYDGDNARPKFVAGITVNGAANDICTSAAVTGTSAGVGCVLRRTGTGWDQAGPEAGGGRDVSDLAINGEFSSASVIVGTNDDGDTSRSTDGAETFDETVDDRGTVTLAVSIQPDDANVVYKVTTGADGGLLVSSNGGSTFNYTQLQGTDYNALIDQFDAGASGGVIRAGLIGNSGTQEAAFASPDVRATNTAWWRGDHTSSGSGSDHTQPLQIRFASNNPANVYLINGDRQVDQVSKSTNGGQSYSVSSVDPASKLLENLMVVNDTTLYVVDDDGVLYWSTNSGGAWSKGCDLGDDVWTLAASRNYANDKTIIAGVTVGGRLEVMRSVDSGATCTKVGSSLETDAWGGGTGLGMLVAFDAKYDGVSPTPAGMNMVIYAAPSADTSDDIYRYNLGASSPKWEEMNRPELGGDEVTGLAVGPNGTLYAVTDDTDGDDVNVLITDCPTVVKSGIDANTCRWRPASRGGNEAGADLEFDQFDGLRVLAGPSGANALVAMSKGSGTGASDEIVLFNETAAFLAGPSVVTPLENGQVPQNSGDEGSPFQISWTDIEDAECYIVQVSLNSNFLGPIIAGNTDGDCADGGEATTESLLVAAGTLINGAVYYTRVAVLALDDPDNAGADLEYLGSWGPVRKFSVGSATAVTTPQASLPLDGALLPGLSTELSWNNPGGTTQVHVQVTPLNNDGPAIDLIFGSAINTYTVPAPVFGTGPYVILPGASYTWRVRTTTSATAAGATDPSWGAWSTPRVFTTADPNAGTIQLLGPINGEAITDTTPTLQWKDSNAAMFYYEVQLSSDPNFGAQGAIAPVYWNLVHAGESNPPGSWTVPDGFALTAGTYSWRVRQRLQATPEGSAETGIAWTPAQTFVVK